MGWLKRATVGALAIAAAVIAVQPVHAGPDWAKMTKADDFPPFDLALRESTLPPPAERSFIAYPNKASSRCIGKPTTPLCAVETLLACFVWERPDLCRMARENPSDTDKTRYLSRHYRLEYAPELGFRASKDDWANIRIEEWILDGKNHYRRVDVTPPFHPDSVVVWVRQRGCALRAPRECRELPKTGDPDEERFALFKYVLRPKDGRWEILWVTSNVWVFHDTKSDLIEIGAHFPYDPNAPSEPD